MRETWKDSRLAYQRHFPNLTRITLGKYGPGRLMSVQYVTIALQIRL